MYGVKGNDRADRLAFKANLTNGLALGRSESLRNLQHKAKDITPSFAWRGKAWREEALYDCP